MVLGLREITNIKKERGSESSNWRGGSSKDSSSNKDRKWNSFSSCDRKRGKGKAVSSELSPLRKSSTAYVPPHLRGKNIATSSPSSLPRSSLTPSLSRSRSKKSKSARTSPKKDSSQHLPRSMVCGPLLGVAVEIFEKAHGINGREKEDFDQLKEQTIAKYKCSERAFTSLVLGHSYDEVLAPLRAQIPGYITKEEARLHKQQLKQKEKQRAMEQAKSCQSSPSTITQNEGEEPSLLVLNDPLACFPSPIFGGSSGAITPASSDYSDDDDDSGGVPSPDRRARIRSKPRSKTEPTLHALELAFSRAQLDSRREEQEEKEEKEETD